MKNVCILLLCACLSNAVGDSCSGRCNTGFSGSYDCQCNSQCLTYGDCCSDYQLECLGSGPTPVTSGDLTTLANKLWSVDGNRASSSQFTINKQTYLTSTSSKVDMSSSSLVSYVDASLLAGDTYATFIALLDNYIARTGNDEIVTSGETNEIDAFIKAIMKTSVMTETYNFLYSKGYVLSKQDLQNNVEEIWFKAYGRSSSSDTSGFEHVFVGEQKSSSVSGFHNWIQLYQEERAGDVNYYGYTKEASPDLLLFQFSWEGKVKELSSVMFGSSPEFEMALFTTCFLTKPNSQCSFTLDGNNVKIQTYDYKGDNVIGSAYFSV